MSDRAGKRFVSIRLLMGAVCVLSLLSIPAAAATPQKGVSFAARVYGRGGYLVLSPSPADMGYTSGGGRDSSDFSSSSKLNLGLGGQLLVSPGAILGNALKFGVDLGGQTLFSDEIDFWYGSDPRGDVHKDHEFAVYALGIVEYSPPGLPLLLQGGVGGYQVYWSWTQDYPGGGNDDSGTGTNLGLMGAAGYKVKLGPNLALPIMARMDYISRYGSLLGLSVTAGIEFAP
jgi:opacity protein-like surface antigen